MFRPRLRQASALASTSTTTAVATTVTKATATATKPMLHAHKAKNSDNQEGLNRLLSLTQTAICNPHYVLTLQRAIKSVRECPHAITTIQQAIQLKYVGPRLARILVPTEASTTLPQPNPSSSSSSTSSTTTGTSTTDLCSATQQAPKATKRSRSTNSTSNSRSTTSTTTTKQQAYQTAKHFAETLTIPKGPWKVWLLVDTREHHSHTMVSQCQQAGIPCEERVLPIGDMTWIARCGDIELVLGTILERKQVADLVGSLFGTRFLEQRLRLKHCGVPQILYLVEGDLSSAPNCPADTLRMAMMQTRIPLGFQICQTKHLEDTVRLLKSLHRRIIQRAFPTSFQELPTFVGRNSAGGNGRKQRRPSSLLELVLDLPPQPALGQTRFTTFAELKAKVECDREVGTQTVGAIYQAMLKQIPGWSQKKCQAMAAVYPTWSHYLSDDPIIRSTHVPTIPCGRQTIGPKSGTELDMVCRLQRDGTMFQPKNRPYMNTTDVSERNAAGAEFKDTTTTTTTTTTTGSTSPTSNTTTSDCFDLTADSPAPVARDKASTVRQEDDLWEDACQNPNRSQKTRHMAVATLDLFFSSDDDDGMMIPKRKQQKVMNTSVLEADHVSKAANVGQEDTKPKARDLRFHNHMVAMKNSSASTPVDLSFSTDDEDDAFGFIPRHTNAIGNDHNNNKAPTNPIADSRSMFSIHEKVDRSSQQLPHANMAKRNNRDSSLGGDSSVWFSSPSSSSTTSIPSPPNKNILQNITNQENVSIVVIDSSDDEDNDNDNVGKPPSLSARTTMTTSTIDTHLTSSSQSSIDDDLRSRLTKRRERERETIVID